MTRLSKSNFKSRFCVIVARYSVSGVPLAQLRLARALASRGYHVDMVFGYVPPGAALPEISGVNMVNWGAPKVRGMLLPLFRYLSKSKPEVIFSAEDHLNAAVLLVAMLARSNAKISASSRVTPYDTYSSRLFSKGWILKELMKVVMWRADVLTCVSEDMVEQYRTIFNDPRHICIYNIVDKSLSAPLFEESVDHPWFSDRSQPVCIAAGQLGPWKGFDDLIRSIDLIVQRMPVRLIILGEGHQREELQALIDMLELGDRVRLEGNVPNPLKYFANADVFALSSLLEGMPNVLIEAMLAGCTPVAANCPTGPREVLESGRYGYLVEMRNPEAMAKGIEQALKNPIPAEILEEAIRPFSEKAVIKRHFLTLGLCEE